MNGWTGSGDGAPDRPVGGEEPIDVLVIGAGAAGAVVASRVSEDPTRSVVLLEAGPDSPGRQICRRT